MWFPKEQIIPLQKKQDSLKTHLCDVFVNEAKIVSYLFSGLVTVGSLSSLKTELRARCSLWKTISRLVVTCCSVNSF